MDTLTLLTHRHSQKKLTLPIPNEQQLEQLFQAATHAPDHGRLQPYRFVVISPQKMPQLSQILVKACQEMYLNDRLQQKAERFHTEVPMAIVSIAQLREDIAKVPSWEQLVCASCATYALQLAANAQGFDNIWLTAPWVESQALRQALHCQQNEKIIGFIAIGTAETLKEPKEPKKKQEAMVSYY